MKDLIVELMTLRSRLQDDIAFKTESVACIDKAIEELNKVDENAADYGLSAKKLNKILNEEKIQHKVNDQWILYSNMMNKGYTKSETIDIERSDGRIETKMHTRWTQKGRLKIHEILTNLGFIANYDREQQKLFA